MFKKRVEKLRVFLKEKNVDAFLVSNFFNILYFSGFKTLTENEREAWMLITQKNTYLFSDSRYISKNLNDKVQVSNQIQNLRYKLITPEKTLFKNLEEIFYEEKIKTCAIEADDLKVFEFKQLEKFFSKINFILTAKLLIKQREIKDKDEIEKIKKACQISDKCLDNLAKNLKIGMTEKEIAFKIEFFLKEKGCGLAFYPIVAIDENSAVIHYDTKSGNNKKLKNSSIILIDFGAKYKDYLSDITRMIFYGKPKNEVLNSYQKLLQAQEKTIKTIKINNSFSSIDQFCRQILTTNYPLQPTTYPHSTGHGVGLEIHEYPKISPVSQDLITPNQVFTIEPGIYIEGKWGMRIEDTVLAKQNGVEVLTNFSKKPLIISNF